MALVNNGVKNDLPTNQIAAGYSLPTVTQFTDHEYVRTVTLTVLKSTVHNATAATTMTNIISNGTIGLNVQLAAIVTADFETTNTVTLWSKWTGLTTNYGATKELAGNDFLTDTAVSYSCIVTYYVKVA